MQAVTELGLAPLLCCALTGGHLLGQRVAGYDGSQLTALQGNGRSVIARTTERRTRDDDKGYRTVEEGCERMSAIHFFRWDEGCSQNMCAKVH